MQSIELAEAVAPLVLAIDIGTSSARALLFDAHARQVDATESQHPWKLFETPDGGLTGDSAALFDLVCTTVDECLAASASRANDIGGVGISTFWHSLQCLDAGLNPHGPLLMWIDNRSRHQAHRLRDDRALAAQMRRETGCRPHSSYWPAKLTWMDETGMDRAGVRWYVSFADYLMLRLTGTLATSIAMASGTGLLDVSSCEWHSGIADRFGVPVDSLPRLVDIGELYPQISDEFRTRWPALAEVPWFPAIGDGAAANVGGGCVGADRVAMTIGTSAAMRVIVEETGTSLTTPEALWEYRLDRRHRVIGGALSNGGNVVSWLADLTAGCDIAALTAEAEATTSADGHGLTWLPCFAGERSPSWNDDATGSLTGLRFSTTRAEMFRAALEGISYRLAMVYDDLKQVAAPVHTVHANGGAALNSPLWMGIIADTFDHPLEAMDADAEVSARGAAVCALTSMGVLASYRPEAIESQASFEPNPSTSRIYRRAMLRQAAFEEAIFSVQSRFVSN